MSQGFVVLAQNTEKVDYVRCAEALAMSIKRVMPSANISIVTDDACYSNVWDEIIDRKSTRLNSSH